MHWVAMPAYTENQFAKCHHRMSITVTLPKLNSTHEQGYQIGQD
jgi:hypothetical protein